MIQDLYTLRKRHRIWQKCSSSKNLKKKLKTHPPSKFNPVRQVVTSAGFQFAHIQQKAVKHWQLNSPKIPSALCIFHLRTIPTANQILCVLRSNYPASLLSWGLNWSFPATALLEKHADKAQQEKPNKTEETQNLPPLFPRDTPCPLHPSALLSPGSVVNKATWQKCSKRHWRVSNNIHIEEESQDWREQKKEETNLPIEVTGQQNFCFLWYIRGRYYMGQGISERD